MTYDQWKCDPGYDDPPEEDCIHEDYETTLEGRASCGRCGHSWWLSHEEQMHEREANEAYDRYCRREERREKWRQVRAWFRGFLPRRKPAPVVDDVPF